MQCRGWGCAKRAAQPPSSTAWAAVRSLPRARPAGPALPLKFLQCCIRLRPIIGLDHLLMEFQKLVLVVLQKLKVGYQRAQSVFASCACIKGVKGRQTRKRTRAGRGGRDQDLHRPRAAVTGQGPGRDRLKQFKRVST